MRAAIYSRRGPASEVLQIVERQLPQPGSGEVRVKLAFSGVNPSDVKSRAGVAARTGGFAEVTPHSDGAGVIDAVGDGVDRSRIGERVWLYNGQWERPFGTAAEFITLPANQAVPLPNAVSFDVGASIGIPLMTAMHAVQACGSLLGKTVLIPGAVGSVGYYATQLACMAGARVIAIVSSEEKAAQARQIGAAETINYKTEQLVERVLALTGGKGADAIIDLDAATHAPLYGQLLRFQGKAIVYGSNQPQFSMPFGPMILGLVNIYCFIVYKLPLQAMQQVIESVQSALMNGALQHPPTAIYPLDEIAAAHEQVERGANAKVLVQV
jgi:NADPH2:quinone reductase